MSVAHLSTRMDVVEVEVGRGGGGRCLVLDDILRLANVAMEYILCHYELDLSSDITFNLKPEMNPLGLV